MRENNKSEGRKVMSAIYGINDMMCCCMGMGCCCMSSMCCVEISGILPGFQPYNN
jgi:hypothetical protein